MNTIILFYNYARIDDPQAFMAEQRTLCESLGLKGRVIIAREGVNATLEGETAAIEKYCGAFLADGGRMPPRFADTHIKRSEGTPDGTAFPRLSVKVRREIVSLGLPAEADFDPRGEKNPEKKAGKYLSAEMLHRWFEESRDFEIVDMRNDYEHKVGHFKGSVLPPLHNFRDLQKALPSLAPLKKKTVVTVCTGGIRCEKASGYLVQNGFDDVYQLHGGIVTYMEKFENEGAVARTGGADTAGAAKVSGNFLGSLYVFDGRTTMAFAPKEKRAVIGSCESCGAASEHYINCADMQCHDKFIVCEKCASLNSEILCEILCSRCRAGSSSQHAGPGI